MDCLFLDFIRTEYPPVQRSNIPRSAAIDPEISISESPVANLFLTSDMRYRVPTSSTSMPDSDVPEPTNWTARLGGGPWGASRHCQLAHSVPEPGTQKHKAQSTTVHWAIQDNERCWGKTRTSTG